MFADDLKLYGPQAVQSPPPTLRQSRRYCRRLARRHYENFTAVSRLLPRRLRQHFANVYAYCRWADDLADEAGDARQSLALLGWWENQLRECFEWSAASKFAGATAGLSSSAGNTAGQAGSGARISQQSRDSSTGASRLYRPGRDHPPLRRSARSVPRSAGGLSAGPAGRPLRDDRPVIGILPLVGQSGGAAGPLSRRVSHARPGADVRFDLHGPATGQLLPGRGRRLGPGSGLPAAGRLPAVRLR